MTIETHERKIELLAELVVTSRTRMIAIDLASLSDQVIARACLHGLTQKIADAASGAAGSAALGALGNGASKVEIKAWTMDSANAVAVQDEAERMMEDAKAKLVQGLWVAPRASVAGQTPLQAMMYKMADDEIKRGLVKKFGDAKKLTGLAKVDRRAKVAGYIAKDASGWATRAQEELDRLAALADEVVVDLADLFD